MYLFPIHGFTGEPDSFSLDLLKKMSIEELMNVKIASFVEGSIHRQPATVTIITNEQLQLSGARVLSEALMIYVPGIFVIEDQDDLITGFRGLAPDQNSKIMVLLNGTNMNIEWFWGAPPNILNSINFDWIERVEVIRGPGSVTYGQGALMGVVNIITRNGSSNLTSVRVRVGKDNDLQTSYEHGSQTEDVDFYLYASTADYNGQAMKAEGWGLRPYIGNADGNVSDQGLRVNKGKNSTALAIINHKKYGIQFNAFYADQSNDLYNFFFDRNHFKYRLMMAGVEHEYKISKKLKLVSSASYMRDDYSLALNSTGFTTGGAREDRIGLKTRLHINQLFSEDNNVVLGVDFRNHEDGRLNNRGDNFLVSEIDSFVLSTYDQSNKLRTYLNRSTTNVIGIFMEDMYNINTKYSVFTALRYDEHPNWGSHISGRFAVLGSPHAGTNLRFSYQNGFRGAVGITYSGGFRGDGFLDVSKFDKVESNIGRPNVADIIPEEMHSFELEVDQKIGESFNINTVGFYNIINNVIDFTGILPDGWPNHTDALPNIGDVPVGDFGGFWHFKNNKGKVSMAGMESSLIYTSEKALVNISHSLVYVVSAEQDHKNGSMYVTPNEKVKAFPQNVTRFNVIYKGLSNTKVSLNYLYYYKWVSPLDRELESNHMANLSMIHSFSSGISVFGNVKNLLDDDKLYPMNNTLESALKDGTPTYEERTYWLGLKYDF